MRQHVDRRHAMVLRLVQEHGTLRVADLARELGVSPVTLRRDVETLAAQGRLRRLHGSVVRTEESAEPPVPEGVLGQGVVVGMVVPTTEYYYAEVVRGAREAVEARGARLVVALSQYLPGEDSAQADRLLASGAHGLLLTPSWQTGSPGPGEGLRITERPVPTVLVERTAPHGHPAAALDRVRSDHAHGAAEAVRHLAALGHRRIALAAQDSPTTAELRRGHEAAVAALGLDAAPVMARPPQPVGEAERFERTFGYLRTAVEEHGVSAAILHSDVDAIVLVPRLRAHGIRVPGDLAVITYDDEVAALADLPLTAVAPAKRTVGRRAAELLLSRLAEPSGAREPGQHLDILPDLRVRESCGASLKPASR
ncbi:MULTISPECIES: substrate-binding domain-containing protein [unclassified Streptomyces]|uniref:substrate-binding domain-containing protein n=1 Tax=unclassified Streptomyces TaxID=2593676 RepID=UPI000DBA2329|nr:MULTISPECIES: substrate-binding domain-containing protein [unclassified Streptomyces]MYT73749.1 substrate-binding domain-containing protein [Streptomyces sp. SID8367]RAJ85290.1 DNA-binding LacI/PurR family transcriptional regulator [Streptomyces sp. PsTaAH-137]